MPKGIGYDKDRSKEDITRAIMKSRGVPPESPAGKAHMASGTLPNLAKKKKRSTLKEVAEKFRRFLPVDVLKKAAEN